MARRSSRTYSSEKLSMFLDESGPIGLAALIAEGLSTSIVQKMKAGTYRHVIKPDTQRKLVRGTKLPLDEICPLVGASKQRAS